MSASYSSSEPSHQWTRSGSRIAVQRSTHSTSLRLAVGGAVAGGIVLVTAIRVLRGRSGGQRRHRGETNRVRDGRRTPANVPKSDTYRDRPGAGLRGRGGTMRQFPPTQERCDDRQLVHPHPDRGRQGLGRGRRGAHASRASSRPTT